MLTIYDIFSVISFIFLCGFGLFFLIGFGIFEYKRRKIKKKYQEFQKKFPFTLDKN